ncbi:MAG: GNAT family N-acetyltransferase [Dehalococcoidales bacterium]|nr:GNAT family N-acetyltransferase [Dehalococcoidales bacterium]
MSTGEKEKVLIRPMTRNDINAVLALDRKIGDGRSSLSYTDMDSTNPGGPADLSIVAEIDGKVVGFILTRLTYLMIPFTEVCLLQGMIIDPAYQGRGTGSQLIERLFENCRSKKINTIRALVPEFNKELREFVEFHKFHRSNIINFDKTFDNE